MSEASVERAAPVSQAPPTAVTRLDAEGSRGRRREEKLRTGRRLCADQRVKGRRWENKVEARLENCSFKINFSLQWLVTRKKSSNPLLAQCHHLAKYRTVVAFWLPRWQPLGRTGLSSDWPLLLIATLCFLLELLLILTPDPIRRKWGGRDFALLFCQRKTTCTHLCLFASPSFVLFSFAA